jgi:hypothetical protein
VPAADGPDQRGISLDQRVPRLLVAVPRAGHLSDLERGINRTARKDTAELLAGALGLAEPARAFFVAAARGRGPATEVLAAIRGQAGAVPGEGPVWCPYLGLVPFQERDARVFYGRGDLVAQLVRRLADRLDGMAETVIAELREGAEGGPASGALPLVSLAMAATWECREGSELTLRAYRRAGGVADAVNRGAQAAYDALTSGQKDAARLLFTQLTVITADGRFGRRRCGRDSLRPRGADPARDMDAVIDAFSARSLLVLGAGSVEIAHDVLLQAWKQLRDWLGDDQLDRVLYSQVVSDAQTWDINQRDSSYLYRPGRLATIDAAVSRWLAAPTRFPSLPDVGQAFLHAAHHAASRGTRQRRAALAGLLALTLIAITAAGIAVHDTGIALSAKGIAVREEGIAVRDAANVSRQHAIALSRQLAAESLAIDPGDTIDPAGLETAQQLAAAAWRVFPTDQAESAMTALLAAQQQDGIVFVGNPGDGVKGVAFSPDGTLLASADADGTVQTWRISLFADPYAVLCADVGPPTGEVWAQYAPGESETGVCG